MSLDSLNPWRRFIRSHGAFLAFLFAFVLLLIGVCYYFLFPGLTALKTASPTERKQLKAWSSLLLAILLITLGCGLILTMRMGRFFFPRPTRPRTETKYVDVWTEAGKRLPTPDPDDVDTEE